MSHRSFGSGAGIVRALLAAGVLLLALAAPVQAASGDVVVLTADGVVDNFMAQYLSDGIASAESGGASAVVIRLDTPGGSLDAMTQITKAELSAKVPVIVWVSPAGGWAASAGTFITLAGNLAYMASGTSIGAASPVGSNGQDLTGTEGNKVRSIAISAITSIAQARGRNVEWAVSAVSNAVSASASEAVSKGVVNGVADSLDAVLAAAQGKQVTTASGPVTLDVQGRTITEAPMNPVLSLLQLVSDPNLAFVLFVVGLAGLLIELVHPTVISGVVGGLCLILAFIGFGSLPLNVAGLLLLAFGMILFALESQITSHGVLAFGGLVAFILGASILYSPPSGAPLEPPVSVASPLIAVMAAVFALFMGTVTIAALRTRGMVAPRGAVGTTVPLGTVGVVRAPLAPVGTVYLGGETWSARTADGRELDRDTPVHLVAFDRLVAVVAPESQPAARPGPPVTQPPAAPPAAHA
jgi:membrane-bound serine protease (ClpP class)